jgi:hypothetical protein
MVLPALKCGGYSFHTQVHIGERFGGGKHFVDVLVEDSSKRLYLISLKWQQVSGTAEQKVPFEAMCLAEAILTGGGRYAKAYLVLGGKGWKLREFFVGDGLRRYLKYSDLVQIVTLEEFVARANKTIL